MMAYRIAVPMCRYGIKPDSAAMLATFIWGRAVSERELMSIELLAAATAIALESRACVDAFSACQGLEVWA